MVSGSTLRIAIRRGYGRQGTTASSAPGGRRAEAHMLPAVSLNLSPGEQVIFEGHPSWRAILGFYLKGIVVAVDRSGSIAKLVDGAAPPSSWSSSS